MFKPLLITDSEVEKQKERRIRAATEKYYECPNCLFEPPYKFPEKLPTRYRCPRCMASRMAVSVRIKKILAVRWAKAEASGMLSGRRWGKEHIKVTAEQEY